MPATVIRPWFFAIDGAQIGCLIPIPPATKMKVFRRYVLTEHQEDVREIDVHITNTKDGICLSVLYRFRGDVDPDRLPRLALFVSNAIKDAFKCDVEREVVMSPAELRVKIQKSANPVWRRLAETALQKI